MIGHVKQSSIKKECSVIIGAWIANKASSADVLQKKSPVSAEMQTCSQQKINIIKSKQCQQCPNFFENAAIFFCYICSQNICSKTISKIVGFSMINIIDQKEAVAETLQNCRIITSFSAVRWQEEDATYGGIRLWIAFIHYRLFSILTGDTLSFSYRFHHWLMLYTLGQYIVDVQSSTTSDGFSTIFIFGIWKETLWKRYLLHRMW